MTLLPTYAIALAAALFVTLSATMNALFLSSLGRTALEAGILAALSIAADLAKAALPIVLVRACMLRAWGQVAGASVMLTIVIALSLASGTGFAALTRGAVTAARQAGVDARSNLQSQVREIEVRMQQLPLGRTLGVLDVEIARVMVDRHWASSNGCTVIAASVARQFCAEYLRLKSERAAAQDRNTLATERMALLARLDGMPSGAGESDAQAAAVADVLGLDAARLRRGLSLALAVIIELGAVILALLLSGSALRRWPEANSPPPPKTVDLPHSKDVSQWHRRRNPGSFPLNGGAADAR